MSTAAYRSPNKLGRSNSISNLCILYFLLRGEKQAATAGHNSKLALDGKV
jgi:hypothetical protein